MRVFMDTEFIEDGSTIDLISIGLAREDGETFYAENVECDHTRASPWVRENVLSRLEGGQFRAHRETIAREIVDFVGPKPEFWAYFADYDWVALCQLYGTMMDLPEGWPKWCRDLKQLQDDFLQVDLIARGYPSAYDLPAQENEHHALADALWTKKAYDRLMSIYFTSNARFAIRE